MHGGVRRNARACLTPTSYAIGGEVSGGVRRDQMHCGGTGVAQPHGPSCTRNDVVFMAGSEETQEPA